MLRLPVLILIVISITSYAQLPDVPAAFSAIKVTPEVLHLKKNHIETPSGGHLQGIQCLSDSELIITASSGSYAYYLTANRTELTSIQKLSDAPFRHAGGCQVYDHTMMVGSEDNQSKDKSEIIVITFDSGGRQMSQRITAHRSGIVKRSTAGAVGVTMIHTGQYLVAVGDWDSRYIDFYLSRQGTDTLFDSLTTYHTRDHQKWCSYQTLNLLTDKAGHIYMIGMGLDGFKNRADLFEVVLHSDRADIRLLSTRNFKCRGTSFRYGSGVYMSPNHKMAIYSIARNVTAHTPVNIFR